MFMRKIIEQITSYIRTSDYLNGVFVEISGIVIELLLLSILLPLFLYIYKLRKSRQSRMIASFYLFQVFHNVSRNFLSMASIEDPFPILLEELATNSDFKIYSNNMYGNLENILFVLNNKVFTENILKQELQKKDLNSISKFRNSIQESLDELDRLISMYINIPKTKDLLFKVRLMFYPVRDIILNLENAKKQKSEMQISSSILNLEKIGPIVTDEMLIIFKKERKIIDTIQKHQALIGNISLVTILLPIEVSKRIVSRVVLIFRKLKKAR